MEKKTHLGNAGKKYNTSIGSQGNPEVPKHPDSPIDPSNKTKGLDQSHTNTRDTHTHDPFGNPTR